MVRSVSAHPEREGGALMNRNAWCALYLIVLFAVVGSNAAYSWGERSVKVIPSSVTHNWDGTMLVTVTYGGASTTEAMNCSIGDWYPLDQGLPMIYTPGSILHGPTLQFEPLPAECYMS